jgi:hypothetical protein
MRDWLEAHKPRASRRTQLLLASLMWSTVGAVLFAVGMHWVARTERGWAYGLVLAGAGIALGAAKSRVALSRAAGRIVERILSRGEGRCLGGFFSVRTWLLVFLMSGAGRLLRGTSIPRPLLGLVYAAIGTALMLASRRLWGAWRQAGAPA